MKEKVVLLMSGKEDNKTIEMSRYPKPTKIPSYQKAYFNSIDIVPEKTNPRRGVHSLTDDIRDTLSDINTKDELDRICKKLDKIDKKVYEEMEYSDKDVEYQGNSAFNETFTMSDVRKWNLKK